MKQFVVLALILCLALIHVSAHPVEQAQQLTLQDVELDAQPLDDGAGERVARHFGGGGFRRGGGFCCGGGGGGGRRGGFGGGGGNFGGSASASASASASSSFGGGNGYFGKK